MKITSAACAFAVTLYIAATVSSQIVHAQQLSENKWKVFRKTHPCAETLRDWYTVADRNPSGGGNAFEQPPPLAMSEFPLTAGGFSAAQTSADVYRLGGFLELQSPFVFRRFRDDCCRVWGVWWLPSTGAMTIRNIHDIVALRLAGT
jgi:hypothetical protein